MNRLLMKFLCLGALVSGAVLSGADKIEYKTRTLEEKLAEPNLRFLASFDKRHINADLAKGRAKALSHSDISLELRGALGFDNGAAYIPNPDEELAYLLKDNLDLKDGALSFWFRCDDFDPADASLKLNIGLFKVEIPLKNGYYNTFGYFFGGWFYIQSRFFDRTGKGIGLPVSVKFPGDKIKKGEWNQILWSFDRDNKQQFFLNGEPLNRPTLLTIPPEITDFEVNKRSFMAFSCRVWRQGTRPRVVAVDDIAVYDQALPEAAVQARYQALLKNSTKKVKLLALSFDGHERGIDKVPLLRCKIDARAMPDAPQSAEYRIKQGEKVLKSGTVKLDKGQGSVLLEVPAEPADYTFEATAGKLTESIPVRTPDFTFIGKYPRRDAVPSPWTEPVWNAAERSYKVWNRKYYFGSGPFPTRIVTDGGVEVLEAGPELYFDGAKVVWQAGKVKTGKSFVDFTGTGKGKDNAVLTYHTRLDFDGAMKTDFTVNGKPSVQNMTLEWTVGKELRKYLMTPNYQKPTANSVYSFGYPKGNIFRTPCLLWTVSGKGGFCWMPEDDGNWVHSGGSDAFSVDLKTGKAVVKLIARPCEIPDGASYNAWFAATPTRPAPENIRGNYGKYGITSWWGNRYSASMIPDPMLAPSYIGIFGKHSFGPYGMGHGQVLSNPMAQYMEVDWDAPGCFIYGMAVRDVDQKNRLYMPPQQTSKIANSNPCPSLNTLFNEWQVSQADKLLSGEYGDRVSTLYYDLGAPCFFCGNELHGCVYKDKFGRRIHPTQMSGFRDQYIRLLDVVRKYDGVALMSHAQDQFIPFVNGLTDWWLPGEQCSAILRNDKYAYVNKLRPYYETEMNRDVLGSGVMFYSWSLGSANREYSKTPEVTEQMMAMMLLYDIDYLAPTEYSGLNFRVWEAFKHYGMHDKSVKAHRFDVQKEITSDNPAVEITWYECPDNYKLAAIVNPTGAPVTARINVGAFKLADGTVYDEYRNHAYVLKDGSFTAEIPPRNFILAGLPAKPRFPLTDDCRWPWPRFVKNTVSLAGSPSHFIATNDFGMSRTAPPALGAWPVFGDAVGVNGQGGANYYYVKFVPLRTDKAVTATVWCRSENAAPGANVSMTLIALDDQCKVLGQWHTVKAKGLHAKDWEKLEVTLPPTPGAVWVQVMLHASAGGRDGRIVFDDFALE